MPTADLRHLAGIPALSIRGPWWWFILHSGKPLENRDWGFHYRETQMARLRASAGRFLVHAAAGCTPEEFDSACEFAETRCGVTEFPNFDSMLRGGVVGKAVALDYVHHSTSPWFRGPGAIVIDAPEEVPFVPCAGALGFFLP